MVHARRCIRCEACETACPQGAISRNGDRTITNVEHCTLCGTCVEACYAGARELVGREMTVDEVMIDIGRDVVFFDQSHGGVTFSGGEPLLQPDFLGALLQACKEREIHTALDTCGFATWKTLESIRPYVDLFLYDLKLMDSTQHQRFTGVPNELILKNLQMLSKAGHNIILRVPIVPGINDDDQNVRQIGAYARDSLGLNRLDILPYHHTAADKYERLMKDYGLHETRPPTDDKMNQVAEILQGFGLQVRIGG